jgi:uncharacterized protein
MAGLRQCVQAFVWCLCFWCAEAAALDVPALKGRVNDYAHLLDERQEAQLEFALARYEEETSNQLVLLTIPSLEGEDLEGFSMRVADSWKIGRKGRDNGVILLIAVKERRIRIEVGYGLEAALTDVEASRIIRNVIAPALRRGDYFGGIASGIDAIIKATKGEFKGTPRPESAPLDPLHGLLLLFLVLIILFTRFGRMAAFGGMMGGMFGGRMGRGGLGGGLGGFGGLGGLGGGGGGFGGGGASGRW